MPIRNPLRYELEFEKVTNPEDIKKIKIASHGVPIYPQDPNYRYFISSTINRPWSNGRYFYAVDNGEMRFYHETERCSFDREAFTPKTTTRVGKKDLGRILRLSVYGYNVLPKEETSPEEVTKLEALQRYAEEYDIRNDAHYNFYIIDLDLEKKHLKEQARKLGRTLEDLIVKIGDIATYHHIPRRDPRKIIERLNYNARDRGFPFTMIGVEYAADDIPTPARPGKIGTVERFYPAATRNGRRPYNLVFELGHGSEQYLAQARHIGLVDFAFERTEKGNLTNQSIDSYPLLLEQGKVRYKDRGKYRNKILITLNANMSA